MLRNRQFLLVLLLACLLGCSNEATRDRSALLERLSTRANHGLGTALTRARRLEGIPAMYQNGEEYAYVRAYIQGPSDIGGSVQVRGAKVVRYVVSNLQRRVASKEEGVLVEAILTRDNDWPMELQLQYGLGQTFFDVVLSKWFAEDDLARGYTGANGHIALQEVLEPEKMPQLTVVRGSDSVSDDREVLAVEKADGPSSTIRYIVK